MLKFSEKAAISLIPLLLTCSSLANARAIKGVDAPNLSECPPAQTSIGGGGDGKNGQLSRN